MIPKAKIVTNLKELDDQFLKSRRRKDILYFSKLAVLELCGWIETSVDVMMLRLSDKKLRDAKDQVAFAAILENTHGFHYYKHFRRVLIQAAGLVTVEKIEARVDPLHLAHLQSEFGNLTTIRNDLAHTYMQGTQYKIDAPSVTISRFNRVYPALKNFEAVMFRVIR